jgi:hypothetical protein
MAYVAGQHIRWQLVRVWTGTRTRERSLKRQGGAARRCPACQWAALDLERAVYASDALTVELGGRAARSLTCPGDAVAVALPLAPGGQARLFDPAGWAA